MLEKCLKMLEFGIKISRPLKVPDKQIRCLKVLEKSLNLNLANVEILHMLTILKQALVCSLNFECPRLGYGFLSIILVLEKCNLGP